MQRNQAVGRALWRAPLNSAALNEYYAVQKFREIFINICCTLKLNQNLINEKININCKFDKASFITEKGCKYLEQKEYLMSIKFSFFMVYFYIFYDFFGELREFYVMHSIAQYFQ